jgi:hypothetical protein
MQKVVIAVVLAEKAFRSPILTWIPRILSLFGFWGVQRNSKKLLACNDSKKVENAVVYGYPHKKVY